MWLLNLVSGQTQLMVKGYQAYKVACTVPLTLIALGGYARIAILKWPGGRLSGELTGHRDGVRDMAFSPDGHLLVSVGGESEDEQHRDAVRLWDVASFTQISYWMFRHVGAVAFHPRGQVIAVGCIPAAVKMWSFGSGSIETENLTTLGGIYALCFSPDGDYLCAANAEGQLALFKVQSDEDP